MRGVTTPADPAPKGTRVCRADEIADGKSQKFRVPDGERDIECFVVRHDGGLHAYVNECRHVAMTLDWVENQFFTEDGNYLMCPTHGGLVSSEHGRVRRRATVRQASCTGSRSSSATGRSLR